MPATRLSRRPWTMHVPPAPTAFQSSPMGCVTSLTLSKLTPRTLSTVTTSARLWLLAPVTSPAPPPLPRPIPVCTTRFISSLFLLFCSSAKQNPVNYFSSEEILLVFMFSPIYGECVGYGSCVYPSSVRYGFTVSMILLALAMWMFVLSSFTTVLLVGTIPLETNIKRRHFCQDIYKYMLHIYYELI